jgi:uncharacterized protein (TIGR02145 family)
MTKPYLVLYIESMLLFICSIFTGWCQLNPGGLPVISNLTYDSITQTSVLVTWSTCAPADSKIRWMASDSNDQNSIYTDSIFFENWVTDHAISVPNLEPATLYKYQVFSSNSEGTVADSGYFITQSLSSGAVEVYFNHTVDTSVSTGENANGNCNFASLLIKQIDSARTSIDFTLWGFEYYTSIVTALINAKNRGVKIRFIYNRTAKSPLLDSLVAHEIPVLERLFDTTYSMHNKFWIFDYRYNTNPNTKYLLTGSANVSHPQFHSDKNNIIIIQDEALCAVYTREFEEMWGSHGDLPDPERAKFGTQKKDNVPHILNVAGTRMEVYFSPSDSVGRFLKNLILTKTVNGLFFSMLKFELPEIEDALRTIFNNGKQVKGVFDMANSTLSGSAYPRMKGLPVSNTWAPPASVFTDPLTGLIHHKYLITDANAAGNKITSTGSFNWEEPANVGNDENSLTIFDPRVNNLFYQEFHSRYAESGGSDLPVQTCPNISGHIVYLNSDSTPLHDVTVHLTTLEGQIIETTTTNWDGYFSLCDKTPGMYILDFELDLPEGGFNAADAAEVLHHFVYGNILSGLYLSSADVNYSGYVNSSDALIIAKRFAGQIGSFASGGWVFEKDTITISNNDPVSLEIHALCYGDVNGSYIPAIIQTVNIPCPGLPSVTYGGQTYNTVQIGDQCWMKENLNIGNMVNSVNTDASHSECHNNGVIEKYCYQNNPAMCSTYGGLYTWDEMMQYSHNAGSQGICPSGWHIQTDQEWCTLNLYLDGSVDCNTTDVTGTTVGNKLKESGTAHWYTPNAGATNESGFTALAAGYRDPDGYFNLMPAAAFFWESYEYSTTQGVYRFLGYDGGYIGRLNYDVNTGMSVRCLKND